MIRKILCVTPAAETTVEFRPEEHMSVDEIITMAKQEFADIEVRYVVVFFEYVDRPFQNTLDTDAG